MIIQELDLAQKITLQIVWGEQIIEFTSIVLDKTTDGIYVSPYIYDDEPLNLNLGTNSGVLCHVFANDSEGIRISWRNILLNTQEVNGEMMYLLRTRGFNPTAEYDDRRKHERIAVRISGKIYDPLSDKFADIMVYDISDIGLSFYVSHQFLPKSKNLTVIFEDNINGRRFNVKVECTIVRTHAKVGTVFHGCKVVGVNKDYLVYGFVKRSARKRK